MQSETIFLLGYALDIAVITWVSRLGWKAVGFMVITNMLLIATFAQKEIVAFGLHTNATNLCYAAAMYGMSIVAAKHSFKNTMKLVHATFTSLVLFIVMGGILNHIPTVSGNQEVSDMLVGLYSIDFNILLASFIAFYISNSLNIFFISSPKFSLRAAPLWCRKVWGNIIGQFADSILFFPIAFYGRLDWSVIVSFTVGGFLLKALLNCLDTIPFILFAGVTKDS